MAIQSFSDSATEQFFIAGQIGKAVGWQAVARVARRKLDMLHYAAALGDLQSPPGNRLEALKGGYEGYHSMRINDRWRVVFQWSKAGPTDVRIVDYH